MCETGSKRWRDLGINNWPIGNCLFEIVLVVVLVVVLDFSTGFEDDDEDENEDELNNMRFKATVVAATPYPTFMGISIERDPREHVPRCHQPNQ